MAEEKDWTIMLYMAGDNNLSDDMFAGILGLREKLKLSGQRKVSFLVYFDPETRDAPSLQIDFTDSQGYVSKIDEESASISGFVKWCVGNGNEERNHKATHYALIFSGHGDGFLQGNFLRDEFPFSYVTGRKLRDELKKIKSILNNRKLDVIGFDACVMNSLETAYEMAEFADILIGSQGYFPNAGWDYARIADKINAKYDQGEPSLSKEFMADAVINSLIESNYRFAKYAGRSIDITSCDLSKIYPIADETYNLAKVLISAHNDPSNTARLEQAIILSHWKCQTFYYDQCVDLSDFCKILKENCDSSLQSVIDSCDNVIGLVKDCVIKSAFVGPEFQFATGLSVLFPWSSYTYKLYFEKLYRERDFGTGSRPIGHERTNIKSKWAEFLTYFLEKTKRKREEHGHEASDITNFTFDDKAKESVKSINFTPRFFEFNAQQHRVGGGNNPRVGGGNNPRGSSVPEAIRFTKNFPWEPDNWTLTDETKKTLVGANIISPTGKSNNFDPV